jgi:hypothetical protein
MSWFVQHDVVDGREALNFSEWDREQELEHLEELVADGDMPPWNYRLLHPDARLSEAEQARLVEGLLRSAGENGGDHSGPGGGGGSDDSSGPGSRG